ncbi:hypothetical protein [Ralstonia sp. ASV6]|uniref:hypothetical protein n=1 Tax=Ralstonia sp. ASV6 TaxID=2795124 RepID=UPI001E51E035|nr:hypothetical protein [Ralstonia sp. ASV6]
MANQVIGAAVMLVVTLQLVLFICSPTKSMKQAYADSWHKTGTVIAHLFQIQPGPDRWIGFAVLGLMAYVAALALALEAVGRYIH